MLSKILDRALFLLDGKEYRPYINITSPYLTKMDNRGVHTEDPFRLINNDELLREALHRSGPNRFSATKRGLLRLWHCGGKAKGLVDEFKLTHQDSWSQIQGITELRHDIFRISLMRSLDSLLMMVLNSRDRSRIKLGTTLMNEAQNIGRRIGLTEYNRELMDLTAIPWLLIYVMEETKIVTVKKDVEYEGDKPKVNYVLQFNAGFDALVEGMIARQKNNRTVSLTKPKPITSWVDEASDFLIARADKRIREIVTEVDIANTVHGQALSKLQQTGFLVNSFIAEVVRQTISMYDAGLETPLPWDTKSMKQTPKRLYRAATLRMLSVADSVQGNVFWSPVFVDFRGRFYRRSTELNDQKDDVQKAMIKMANPPKLGPDGLRYLLIHASNTWGNDKAPLDERVDFALSRLDEWVSFAADPFNKTGWFKADAPFSFLAVCQELKAYGDFLLAGGNGDEFRSGIIVYFDGTNNGPQHMAAMLRDRSLAELVNVANGEERKDAYLHISEALWEDLRAETPPDADQLMVELEEYQGTVDSIREQVKLATDPVELARLREMRRELYDGHKELIKQCAPIHLVRIADTAGKRRKLVKRGVMTLGYGVTKGGMAQQAKDDFEYDAYPRTERLILDWFGRRLYDKCTVMLPAITRVKECLAKAVVANGQPVIVWDSPSGFPVVMLSFKQEAAEFGLEDFALGRLSDTKLMVFFETEEFHRNGAANGISPNVVHSVDAAHLAATVLACDFPVTAIHDSFGSAPGNSAELFRIVREQFAELHQKEVLLEILTWLGHPELLPSYGDLDVNEVVGNDYAFS